jgi:hypothetical protein
MYHADRDKGKCDLRAEGQVTVSGFDFILSSAETKKSNQQSRMDSFLDRKIINSTSVRNQHTLAKNERRAVVKIANKRSDLPANG